MAIAVGLGVGVVTLLLLTGGVGAKPPKPGPKPTPPVPPKPTGRPLCPSEVAGHQAADTSTIKVGDYVIVTLANQSGTLRESTWAEVLSVGTNLGVKIVSSQVEDTPGTVVPESLETKWHGFSNGQKLFVDRSCVWDVLRTHTGPGTLVCGPKGAQAAGTPPVGHRDLRAGDSVKVLLGAPDGTALEAVWATVKKISPTGSIVTAALSTQPQHTTSHGFSAGAELDFARDCIFGIRPV